MTGRTLLLTPSRGLGGGIERYADTLEWAFAAQGVECLRVDLHYPAGSGSRAFGHARMLAQSHRQLRANAKPTRLVIAHRCLLPMALLLAKERPVQGISLVCHGTEVWDKQFRPRRYIEKRQMRSPAVRLVAVSSFTAGVLCDGFPATILPPGLSQEWFDTLVEASTTARVAEPEIQLTTAFRLADWEGKGLPQLLAAVAALGRRDIRVTICGSGEPPPKLLRLVGEHLHCTLRPGLTDRELARQLASADLFVLATRTRFGRRPCGEGFGLVLLEAQVAGTPVIGPAYGGSHDAFINGVTGTAPADETVNALAKVLDELLRDPAGLARMGKRAAEWARECFVPERYASRAVARLL